MYGLVKGGCTGESRRRYISASNQYRCMQQDADPAWQDILGETVVRVGGAVHPVHFATKSCWHWRANLDSVYGLFHRIELFLVRDQTVRYHLPANPGNIIAVKSQ